jgi:seryl-tRNA synthetase
MIDLKAARNDPETFRAALARKGAGDAFDALLSADERWRALVPRIDELRGRTKVKGKPSPEQLADLQQVKEQLKAAEEELTAAEEQRDRLALRVPNPPHADVPDGSTEDDSLEVRRVGKPAATDGAREHLEVGRFDMERAARMSGARFGYWIGDTARLSLALYRLALDRLAEKGFVTVLPPVLVREEALIGTGAFPSDEANVYEVEADGLYLAGTAEIPLASLHAGEIIDREELPLRYVEHERLLANTEELVAALGLPYRVVVLPAGDMSSASAKTYDVEIWFPSQERYRETASISNTTDFQARRLGIRYRGERGVEPVHTLNGTAVVDRMALAILENFQGEVPHVLRPYGAPERVTA